MKSFFGIIALSLFFSACRTHSDLNESPGHANPQILGIKKPVRYDDLVGKLSMKEGFEKPWASDYWAKSNRSLAMRWRTEDRNNQQYRKLSEYLVETLEMIAQSKVNDAEVADFVAEKIQDPNNTAESSEERLSENNAENSAETSSDENATEQKKPVIGTYLGFDLLSPAEKYDLLISDLSSQQVTASPNIDQSGDLDFAKRLEMLVLPAKLKSELSYLSALEAKRDDDDERSVHKRLLSAIRNGTKLPYIKENFPLVVDGFYDYTARAASERHSVDGNSDGDLLSWDWEGICHGWSAAAISQKEPKHAVLAKKDGKDVLFLENDIRGLLSKAWANQSATPKEAQKFFLGGRCRLPKDKIMRDKLNNRVLDGIVCRSGNLDSCRLAKEQEWVGRMQTYSVAATERGTQKQVLAMRYNYFGKSSIEEEYANTGELAPLEVDGAYSYALPLYKKGDEFTLTPFDDTEKVKEAMGRFEKSAVLNRVITIIPFASLEDMQAFLKIPRVNDAEKLTILHTDCRALNPATIHMALTEFMHDRNQSLVMDVTASEQVWNQPISGFDIEEFQLQDYSLLKEKDQLKDHRAKGTKYLAEVKTTIHYQAEPLLFYVVTTDKKDGFKKYNGELITDFDDIKEDNHITLNYTLEFDFRRNLIGGEWGLISKNDWSRYPDKAPDFMWGFRSKNVENHDHGVLNFSGKDARNQYDFDASYLKKIHKCSLNDTLKKKTVKLYDHHLNREYEVPFVECSL